MTVRRRFSRWAGSAVAAAALLLALPLRAEVSASVEPRVVDEFDTVRLTVRDHGTSQAVALDLDPLTADFEVLTSQSSGQYRSINGQVEAWVDYQIILRPRSAGELKVPSIQVRGQDTPALTVRVRGIDAELRDAIERMVFFETKITRDPVYVQAQTVLIRRLYYASGAQIYSDLPGLPEVPHAIVMPLGETTSSTTIRDGQRYGVIEQRFAILPERSGELTIPPISVTSSVRLEAGGRTRRSGVRVATETRTVTVLPIPAEYPADRPWLPAEDVSIVDRWEPEPDAVEVGDPLRRVVTARVRGNVSSAIPPLQTALPEDQFRSYPEPAGLEDDVASGVLFGVRQEAFAIVPTAPGRVTLPPSDIVWWDVDTEQVRRAATAGRVVAITGTAAPVAEPGRAAEPVAADGPAAADPETESPAGAAVTGERPPAWPLWLPVAGAAALVLLAAAWLLRRTGPLPRPAAVDTLIRRRALRQACAAGDPARLQAELHQHLRRHYGTTLPDALQRFRSAGHGEVLDALNVARYRGQGEDPELGRAVLAAVTGLARRERVAPPPLPALYD